MTLYLESASPEEDYQLDEVVLEPWQQDQSWRLEAEADIEALRKRELRISFRGVDARSLTVEVEEDHHHHHFIILIIPEGGSAEPRVPVRPCSAEFPDSGVPRGGH